MMGDLAIDGRIILKLVSTGSGMGSVEGSFDNLWVPQILGEGVLTSE